MYKSVKIGTKEVGMLSNAASPFIYKQLFKDDFLEEMRKDNPDTNAVVKMAFVIAMQAEKKVDELMKLNVEQFLVWLENFEVMEVYENAPEIMNVIMTGMKSASVPKGKGE